MKKYKRGSKILNMNQFIKRLEKRLPFYWRHKFIAAGFIEHWSVVQIRNSIKAGVLIKAEIDKD